MYFTECLHTNGICERFHRTMQDEFYATAFRKKIYNNLDELQKDVDVWLDYYNNERTHTGKYCYGKTPRQTWIDSLHLAKEKLLSNLYQNVVSPMIQQMTLAGKHNHISESGYCSQVYVYQAQRCTGCPLHGLCHKSKENRCIEVNHTLQAYRKEARELLVSEERLRWSKCLIDPEAVFGQIKANKHYKRFRHFGKDKIAVAKP